MTRSSLNEVVIIDDDPAVATLARRICEAAGFIVSVAHDLQLGLELLTPPPAIVIVDMHLGGDSGAELIRRAVAMKPAPAIIAISGAGAPALYDAIEAGADRFLEKPFPMSRLRDSVDRLWAERLRAEGSQESAKWVHRRPWKGANSGIRPLRP